MSVKIKEEWNTAYKVFRKITPDWKAGSTSSNPDVTVILSLCYPLSMFTYYGVIEYKYKDIIFPKFGKIYGFKTLTNAEYFKSIWNNNTNFPHLEIWKISAKFSKLPPAMAPETVNNIKYWWDIFEETGKKPKNSLKPPHGTVLCDAVKLIEKVE